MRVETAEILAVERCGVDIVTVRLERPEGYTYKAGQWFRATLATASGPETRTFSHAATPADGWIEFTTRLSPSAFKQSLALLAPGDRVEVSPPGGRFALPAEQDTFVFLIGGVGITPVRCLVRDAGQTDRRFADALLVYGNRDESCEPYLEEMMALAPIGVRVVRVLERAEPSWEGATGVVTAEIVRRHARLDASPTYVIAGPPPMVLAMYAVLDELGVKRDSVIAESFGTLSAPASQRPLGGEE